MDRKISERVALKDEKLIYRACSQSFAVSVGFQSPADVIGKTDFDLFPGEMAREQMVLDSQAIFTASADISTIDLGAANESSKHSQAMIVRTPVVAADNYVRGIDIRLLDGLAISTQNDESDSTVGVDQNALFSEGSHGILIASKDTILFANDNAARVFGYASANFLLATGVVQNLFEASEYQGAFNQMFSELTSVSDPAWRRFTLTGRSRTGATVRLLARVTIVDWGNSETLLFSFIDVALQEKTLCASAQQETDKNNNSAGSSPEMSVKNVDQWRISRSNEQRFRHYASAAADFFWETDAHCEFRMVSDELAQILAVPREKLLGESHEYLIDHPSNVNEESLWRAHIQQLQDHQPFRDFKFQWFVDGETKVIRYSGIPVFNKKKEFLGYRGVGCDVTASVRQAEATAYYANHDSLTGLSNRRSFEHNLSAALENSRETRKSHAMCFMDLDSFKIVNDTSGHLAGDELLRQLAQLFDSLVRKSDVLARLGGDEFGILLYKCSVAEALKLANQIRHEVENFEFLWQENRFTVGVSVGLVVVDDRWENTEALFNAADSACYMAKNEGRNRVVVYRESHSNTSNRSVATHWVEQINSAAQADRIRLSCQKIIPLQGQTEGLRFEMLLRLELPDGELVTPQSFLPTAERYGLVSMLDEHAIRLTLQWLKSNPALHQAIRHVCINLSAGSCTNPEFAVELVKTISNSVVDPSKLCFEISETATIANLSKVSEFMEQVAALGCRFSIDDFGSGLSSFAYLRKLPVDFLKIDGTLVHDILDDPTDYTMVRAIDNISKSMGKQTIAEFIESPELLEAVSEIGIDFGQGFHLGEPELIV